MSEVVKRILEVADEELVLDASDHARETRQNTWSIGLDPAERNQRAEIAVALRECARRVGLRFPEGAGVFYAWYDYQNASLYVSATTRDPDALPFGSRVEFVSLEEIIDTFCAAPGPQAWPGFTAVWAADLSA